VIGGRRIPQRLLHRIAAAIAGGLLLAWIADLLTGRRGFGGTSLVSGVVVYAPFMRKLAFGTVRKDKSKRVKWLDTHNMIGIVALAALGLWWLKRHAATQQKT
jgi:uncharacterized iron-regulated membrane protein